MVLAGDISPIDVITHVPVLCEDNDIPYVYVPAKEVSTLTKECLPAFFCYFCCICCIAAFAGCACDEHPLLLSLRYFLAMAACVCVNPSRPLLFIITVLRRILKVYIEHFETAACRICYISPYSSEQANVTTE